MLLYLDGHTKKSHCSAPERAGYSGDFNHQAILRHHIRQSSYCACHQSHSASNRGRTSPFLPSPKQGTPHSSPWLKPGASCGGFGEAERDRNITLFKRDVRRQYTTVRVTSTVYDRAGNLCRIHRLRAYDAVQLASALLIRSKLAVIGVPTLTFVSADVELLSIGSDEGLSVENPIS